MSGWTPEEIELREALVDEFSYVIPNERAQALECVLKTFEVLERLGWRKEPTLADPSSWKLPPAQSDFPARLDHALRENPITRAILGLTEEAG